MNRELLLETRDLTGGYPHFQVQRISFSLRRGEWWGVIGPNGSGKSTLLRLLTRSLKSEKGNILFKEKDLAGVSLGEFARRVAVVSQTPATAMLGVREYVLLGRIPHYRRLQFFESPSDRDIADRALEMTGISHLREKSLGSISGGERQLVFIARALCQEPELLILDEPTTFLDISHQVAVMDLIKRLNREQGLSVLMTLHDLNLAGEYCQKLLLLNQGRPHVQGTPAEVLTYQTIEQVYQTVVIVRENPLSGRPFVIIVSQENRGRKEK